MDGGNVEAEHHAFIVDGLVTVEELADRFVDGFRNATLDDMADSDGRAADLFEGEYPICSFLDRCDEALMGDCHLIVLAEHRDDTIFLEMVSRDFLGVGLDEWECCWLNIPCGMMNRHQGVFLDGWCIQRQQWCCRLVEDGSFHKMDEFG